MPTIQQAVETRALIRIGGNLRRNQVPTRVLLATPEVIKWMTTTLAVAQSDGFIEGAATPKEQVMRLANQFVSGSDIGRPLPHTMKPHHYGIYRLRTSDVRLDGWIPKRCHFIIAIADLKSNCVGSSLRDNEMLSMAIKTREKMGVEDGRFLKGNYDEHI